MVLFSYQELKHKKMLLKVNNSQYQEIFYGKHGGERRQKNNNNKERHSYDHHLREKGYKNVYRSHWFS